jgi:hypothetical protein
MGFEPMVQASERAKTVHALDRSATVTGQWMYRSIYSWPWHQLEVSDQLQAPSALPPEEEPWYPLDRRLPPALCQGNEWVELYLHYAVNFREVVLNVNFLIFIFDSVRVWKEVRNSKKHLEPSKNIRKI